MLVIRNLTPADVTASCEALVKAINESQIIMLPGGFSGGDEPDGSAKFIASFFRNPEVTEAVAITLTQLTFTFRLKKQRKMRKTRHGIFPTESLIKKYVQRRTRQPLLTTD